MDLWIKDGTVPFIKWFMFNVLEENNVPREDILLWKFSTPVEKAKAIDPTNIYLKYEENDINITTKKSRSIH